MSDVKLPECIQTSHVRHKWTINIFSGPLCTSQLSDINFCCLYWTNIVVSGRVLYCEGCCSVGCVYVNPVFRLISNVLYHYSAEGLRAGRVVTAFLSGIGYSLI